MHTKSILATFASVALLVAPASAVAAKPATTPGNSGKAKAYGKYCKNQSKKHVKGQKGTPFSRCVNAMAKLDKGEVTSAKAACKTLSKKHVKGQKGTPYSRCVVAAAQLLKDKDAEENKGTEAPSTTTTS